MLVVRWIRSRATPGRIAERARAYTGGRDDLPDPWCWPHAERAAWQLERLNAQWRGYVARIPYYRELALSGRVPGEFRSWEEFLERVPAATRAEVRADVSARADPIRRPDCARVTGGSTGQPVRLPGWASVIASGQIDKWVARSWYGLNPTDRLFMIWGHAHALGSGVGGAVRAWERRARDRLLGTMRFSAYDLGPARAREAVAEMLRHRPRYVIGYSGALEQIARQNRDRAPELAALGLSCVIATGEVFPTEAGPGIVRAVFGCPVAMEYGSVETDIMAHTFPGLAERGGVPAYRVLWRTFFLEAGAPGPDGARPLRVTSLWPRAFPLVRYEVGDEAELFEEDAPWSLARFRRVIGRTNTLLRMPDGREVHTMGLKHCVEECDAVMRFQFVRRGEGLELRVQLAEGRDGDAGRRAAEEHIRARAARVHPGLAGVRITFDEPMIATRAGKIPLVAEVDQGASPAAEFARDSRA